MSGSRYEVIFMRGQSEVDVPFQDKSRKEAAELTYTLNCGLQDKARVLGFHYEMRLQKSRVDDGREHDATDDLPGYEESRPDYLPEPEF
jgi:hypothetical protein